MPDESDWSRVGKRFECVRKWDDNTVFGDMSDHDIIQFLHDHYRRVGGIDDALVMTFFDFVLENGCEREAVDVVSRVGISVGKTMDGKKFDYFEPVALTDYFMVCLSECFYEYFSDFATIEDFYHYFFANAEKRYIDDLCS